MSTSDLKDFKDPLYEGIERKRAKKRGAGAPGSTGEKGKLASSAGALAVLALAAAGLIGYAFYEMHNRYAALNEVLAENQNRLQHVSQDLMQSHERIEVLHTGLSESDRKLQAQGSELNRYRTLYAGLQSEQVQQTRELQALSVQKADQSAVENLRGETLQLKGETSELKEQLSGARQDVSELRATAVEHGSEIQQTRASLTSLEETVEANTGAIADVRRSLEREYYNFELYRGAGYMKVFDVALRLTGTSIEMRQFDLDMLTDGKIIRKRKHAINEPILFYVQDQKKPYEIVVTGIEKNFVVGYLSIPKS